MKTTYKLIIILFLAAFTFQSCQDNDDIAAPSNLEIQDFIWKGMNQDYLWQEDVPNLSDDRFATQTELNNFLKAYPVPEDLFDALLFRPKDKFSWIVKDYLELEQSFQGTTKNNGIDFGLSYKSSNSSEIIGFVRYILPNSDASSKDIKRGEVFYAVNGTQLTVNNYANLLYGANESYTLSFANLTYDLNNNPVITPNGKTLTLNKTILAENPIFINKTIVSGTHKIGYLMYNGFYSTYDLQLNEAFADLKAKGATDLVLDLRYNGGGSVLSATRLASMITGHLKGQVFSKLQWNAKNSNKNRNYLFVDQIESKPISSLNLPKIYILTSKSTASASELIINGLKPYITVVQIGDITYGKNVASITLYDSPDFTANKRNPRHRYAMQPIVANTVNSEGFGDYLDGLEPNYQLNERISTLGILGDETEPLLKTAINQITGTTRMIKQNQGPDFKYFTDSKSINGQNQMYIENAPEGLLKSLK